MSPSSRCARTNVRASASRNSLDADSTTRTTASSSPRTLCRVTGTDCARSRDQRYTSCCQLSAVSYYRDQEPGGVRLKAESGKLFHRQLNRRPALDRFRRFDALATSHASAAAAATHASAASPAHSAAAAESAPSAGTRGALHFRRLDPETN